MSRKKPIDVRVKLFPKQQKVLRLLFNFRNGVTQVLFGGAAGGGKSIVICAFAIMFVMKFKGSKVLIGRSRLITLKQTTLESFFWLCNKWGIKEGVDFTYNDQRSEITWIDGGGKIILKDLFLYPKDPDFDNLGSMEINAYAIDEGNQVAAKAQEVLETRCRYDLKAWCDVCGAKTMPNEEEIKKGAKTAKVLEWNEADEPELFECGSCGAHTEGLSPKGLITCNPAKNWVFINFYKALKRGILESYRRFIPATSEDNPSLPKSYIKTLDRLTGAMRLRLRLGSWEHSDPLAIFDPDRVSEMFHREKEVTDPRHFMSVDPSGVGKDDAEIVVCNAQMIIVEWITLEGKLYQHDIEAEMNRLIAKYNIDAYDIAIDVDGVGHGLASTYEYAHHIYNAGSPLFGEKFENIKTQLYFRLADLINDGAFTVNCWTQELEDKLSEELGVIQQIDIDKDGVKRMTKKIDIKAALKRSPNKSDALAYMAKHFMEDLDNSYLIL